MIPQKHKNVLASHKNYAHLISFDMKRRFRWLPFLVVALCSGGICTFNFQHAHPVGTETTSVRFRVTDLNDHPLFHAEVSLPEHDLTFFTDNNGYTPKISLPVTQSGLSEKLNTDWFPVTVCARRDGFVPTVLFHCILYRSRFRDGPTLRLFSQAETSAPFVAIVETPPDDWTKDFLTHLLPNENVPKNENRFFDCAFSTSYLNFCNKKTSRYGSFFLNKISHSGRNHRSVGS